eukprot:331392-Chlamydomonas_euryale.AAC.15
MPQGRSMHGSGRSMHGSSAPSGLPQHGRPRSPFHQKQKHRWWGQAGAHRPDSSAYDSLTSAASAARSRPASSPGAANQKAFGFRHVRMALWSIGLSCSGGGRYGACGRQLQSGQCGVCPRVWGDMCVRSGGEGRSAWCV